MFDFQSPGCKEFISTRFNSSVLIKSIGLILKIRGVSYIFKSYLKKVALWTDWKYWNVMISPPESFFPETKWFNFAIESLNIPSPFSKSGNNFSSPLNKKITYI